MNTRHVGAPTPSRPRPRPTVDPHADVTVRSATLDDLPVVVELRLALLREYEDHAVYGRLRPDAEARAFVFYRAQIIASDQTILLAEREGSIVGILRCVDAVGSPLLFPARYAYVSSAYVRPSERRSGILRALMAQATAWCRARGLTEMRLHNAPSSTAAVRTWDALEFEVMEQVRFRSVD